MAKGTRHLNRLTRRSSVFILVALLGVAILAPLLELQHRAFADGATGYRTIADSPWFWSTLRTTAGLALGSVVLSVVLGVGLGWASTKLPSRLRFLQVLPILPIVVPAVANVAGWSFLLSPRVGLLNGALRWFPWWSDLDYGPVNIYSFTWIMIITGIALTSFVYLFVLAGIKGINPELIEAAAVSGSSARSSFFKIVIPLLRPSLVYGSAVSLLLALGQFTAPIMLGRTDGIRVVTTEVYRYISLSPSDYAAASAYAAPLTIVGLLIVIWQRITLGDHSRYITHTGKSFKPLTTTSKWAPVAMVSYALVAAAIPLGALVIVALSPFWSGKLEFSSFTLKHVKVALGDANIVQAITNSLQFSFMAVAIALPLGFLIASILLRAKNMRLARVGLDTLIALPLGVPALVFGAAFLFTYTKPPFVLYGTSGVVILVYVVLMLPFAVRMQLSGMMSHGTQFVEAARVSGAGVIRTNLTIVVPMMRSALGATAALMFILLSHEFAASLLVRSPTTQVMGTVLYDAWTGGSFSMVAVIALMMSFITACGVGVALFIGGRNALESL